MSDDDIIAYTAMLRGEGAKALLAKANLDIDDYEDEMIYFINDYADSFKDTWSYSQVVNVFKRYIGRLPNDDEAEFLTKLLLYSLETSDLFLDSEDYYSLLAGHWLDCVASKADIYEAFNDGFAGNKNTVQIGAENEGRHYNHDIEYLETAYKAGHNSNNILKRFGLTQADFN